MLFRSEIDYSVEGILQRYYIKMDITSSPTDNMYFQFEMKIQDSDDKNENPESPFKIPGFSLPIMGNFAIITIVGLVTLTKKRKS